MKDKKSKGAEHKAEHGGRALDDVEAHRIAPSEVESGDIPGTGEQTAPAQPVKASADLKAEFLATYQTIATAKSTIEAAKIEAASLANEIGERMAAKKLTRIEIGGEWWKSRHAKGGKGWTLHREKEEASGDLD